MCYTVYITKILTYFIGNRVGFSPKHNNIPGISNQESSTDADLYLIGAISNPAPADPFSTIRALNMQDIMQLEGIFKQNTTQHKDYHKETPNPRVDNPPKTTTAPRMTILGNLPSPAPLTRKFPKKYAPTPIVKYLFRTKLHTTKGGNRAGIGYFAII